MAGVKKEHYVEMVGLVNYISYLNGGFCQFINLLLRLEHAF